MKTLLYVLLEKANSKLSNGFLLDSDRIIPNSNALDKNKLQKANCILLNLQHEFYKDNVTLAHYDGDDFYTLFINDDVF